MTSAPVTPAPEVAALSEPARIIDTFIAPSKTFTDIRRSAAWWGPFLITVLLSVALAYTIDVKVGYRRATEHTIERSPKATRQLDQLSREDREKQIAIRTKGTRFFMYYLLPPFILIMNLVIAGLYFGTFKFALSADIKFWNTFAVVMYAGLAVGIRTILAIVSLFVGLDPDSFNLQNPAPTNIGYFLDPTSSPFLYSLASNIDLFIIWALFLTALGLSILSKKVKFTTAMVVVVVGYAVFVLASSGLAALGS
jgi:hypothetical protein